MEFQEELLSGVLDHRDMKIPNKQEAIFRLMHQRVLVVIDCVSFVELQALQKLVQQWYLRFGSKVIVTNADLYTFTDNGIEQIYKVTYPSREEALQIFSYAAFGQSSPPRGYLKHAVEVTKLIDPFPLALKILGSALRGKNKEEWTMAPAKVNTCLVDTDIQKATRFAHDGLSKKHKRLFYLLTRETTSSSKNLNNAIYTLSGSDWDVEKGLQTLADMALISISEGGEIMMHGLVQSMSTRLRWNRAGEAEMISKIVIDVSNELPSTDFDQLVGVEAHLEKMRSVICLDSDEVKIVGIWGPDGIGKSTIVRALYNNISSNFQLKFYRERGPTNSMGLLSEVLSGMLDHRDMKILDLQDAQYRLTRQRVLLVLDDVASQHLQVLQNLFRSLLFGSKVIVVNKDIETFTHNGIEQIYKVPYPSSEEALQIFSYSAFGQSSPPRGYFKHAVEVSKLIAPFPLGLKVLGSALRGKSEEEWTTAPAKLRAYLGDKDIEKTIRFAVDGLSEKHKNLYFSLTSASNRGKNLKDSIYLLAKGDDWDVEKEIQTLADMALIYISSEGEIMMHDLHENIFDGSNIITDEIGSGDAILNPIFSTLDPGKSAWGSIYDNCTWCGNYIPSSLPNPSSTVFYRCSICNFCLDTSCARNNPPLTIENPKGHHHSLVFFPRPLLLPCDACGLVDRSAPSYACFQCNYMVHQLCVDLPRVIKITRHSHRLSYSPYLLPPPNSLCRICYKTVDIKYGQYSCKDEDCSYILHSKCATHVMVWDGKELEWEPEEVVTEDIAPFKNVGDELIEHFGHEHHLKLEKYDSIRDAKKQCQACVLPIVLHDFYNCIQCDYFLHIVCAGLPRKLDHALHNHSIFLDPFPPPNDSDFNHLQCSACSRTSSGFKYKCYEKDCKIHWFKIDVTCCLVPEYSTQKFHEDPIFIAPYNYDHEIYPCNGCKRRLTKTRLQCTLCEFSICYECATIPEELHYKHDEHPLTLCYGEDTDGKYWCEECEKQVNPSEWFYTCNKCCITIHRTCLFGFYVYLKPGHTLKYNRATTVEVLGNSISTRPICSRDNDAVMIERIVTNVLQELNWCTPSKDFKDLVGLEAHVSNLNSMLCLDSNEVKIIGIWGPAGIGKTTIARALYNQLSSSGDDFQLNLFMENVKGVQRRNELHGYSLKLHLQERFLSEIFNQRTKISHLGVAQERLKNQKALVVLDDVDGLEQLNALIDTTEWFGYGTRIIVTTEDRQLLKAHGINQVYEVGYPSQGEAFKILCRYAFGDNSAPKGFYDLATEVTKLAGDLPLGLSVLATDKSHVYGFEFFQKHQRHSESLRSNESGETVSQALPTNINLESLSVLNLRGCSKLKRFPCISTQVQFMSLGETAIEKVPSLIRLCSRLVSLEMAGCKNLKTLPPVPASIEILDLSKTRVEASEAQMISKIVKDVSNELPSTDFDRLVGVEAHVAKLKSMIRLDSDEVKMVGIWGPAGIGKTTIAKALYNQVSSNFQLKFYKEIFKGKYEVHNLERYDLQNRLKKELLSGILDHRDMKIPDLGEAEERLKHQRVLLILDDVFLHDLKGLRDVIHGLRYGSKVIVTSEDIDTLRECGIHQNQTYRVAFPSSEEALQIISYSAFGQRFPPRSYLEHADEVAKLVSPFPLGLRVIGSSLRGKSKDEWITALAKLKTCHGDKDVETAIRFAYEGLSDKQKTLLYLLTDSISSGENVNNAIFSLSQSDWDAEKGIQTLADIAFISISGEGRILMHYLKAKVLIFLLLLFVESMAGPDTTAGSSRHEKRKEARLQKNQKKHESWLQRQKLQKEKRVSASSTSVQTKTDDVIKSATYKETEKHVKSVSPGGNKDCKKSFTQKKSEVRVKPKEKKMQRGHKTKDLNKPRKKTKFEEYLEMETQSASLSREQDVELERKLAKKLKVKNGKLRGVDDGMNDLFEGLPSVLDSMESELGDSRKKKGKRKRPEEKQDYEEDFDLGESDFSDEDSEEEPKRKRDRKHRKKKSLDEEVETHPMEITDDGESETVEYDEKVESPLRKPNPESGVKYVAPHLRSQARSESEEQAKLRTRVKGLLNKMAESNVETITSELSTLYRSVARSVSSQIFCEEVLATYARGNEQYAVFAAFIAGMACQVGMDFSAQLIASLAKSFEDEYQKEDSLSLNGITLLLSYLCLLGVCSSDLIYDFLMTLANRLTEVDACTILIVLDSCGMKIRSDDPVAMKTFIISIQNKTNEIKTSPDCKTDINKFTMEKMLETIAAIKNNKLRAKEDSVQNTRVKKWLQKLRVEEVLLRGLTWSKLLDTEKKGQWWLSGDLAVKTNHAEDVAQTMDAEVVEAQKMLKLADAQRMNTDSRKAIFCVIMSSEDYIDAFEKLLRLDLPGKQDREIMRVLVECCLQEKVFNKYYTELETMSLQRSMHLAKFVAEMIVSFNLSLAVLKCVDLANPVQLTPKRIMHFRMLFEAIFEHTEKLVWNLFTRIAVNPDYEALRDGIKFFMKEYVVKANKTIYGKFRKAKEALNNSDGSLLIGENKKLQLHGFDW
ncbi:hypothetical protein IGI04_004962 [Brassica rapa subsp. trilocularis]|uniref:MI domain-containing protein n=2 Tax=Brassica campestris TaxID=3711 RepID=A0ABQ7ND90_BRACM|nr:hypothetical protein IGI04_004962 [Brassica rapa subsp. trilocularis]